MCSRAKEGRIRWSGQSSPATERDASWVALNQLVRPDRGSRTFLPREQTLTRSSKNHVTDSRGYLVPGARSLAAQSYPRRCVSVQSFASEMTRVPAEWSVVVVKRSGPEYQSKQ